MNKIIVETTDEELKIDESQDYLIMRSKLFAEKIYFFNTTRNICSCIRKILGQS